MFVETLECRVRLVRPRSFAGLMTLYESNHVRLRQLLGSLQRLPSSLKSRADGDLSLHMRTLAHSRYTSELHLTYRIPRPEGVDVNPDMVLRVYHDARLVEALRCCERPRLPGLGLVPAVTELERRWSLNIFLNKWLEYCLDHHHVLAA